MTIELNPQQVLFLMQLSFEADGMFLKDMPKFETKLRDALVQFGLIEVSKCKPDLKGRAIQFARLTEAGWSCVASQLETPLPRPNKAANEVLRRLLRQVKSRIDQGAFSYADFVRVMPHVPPVERSRETTPEKPIEISRRIIDACRELTDGVYNTRIRLSDLRHQLADVPRPELDEALKELERERAAALMPLDDPREIQPADEEAAMTNSIGEPRHILYLSQPK